MRKYSWMNIFPLMGCMIFALPMPSKSNALSGMRDTRYCEVILTKSRLALSVYNTMRLNDCPQSLWEKLTIGQIKEKTGASFVELNGPRYFVIDAATVSSLNNKEKRLFGDIEMHETGVVHLTWSDLFKNHRRFYQEHTIESSTTYVYQAGRPIYELISPKGEVYLMQSYSIQHYQQSLAGLASLHARLSLPKGWAFRTGVLKTPAYVTPINHKAYVLQDNLYNSYQKGSRDYLANQDMAYINVTPKQPPMM